MPFAEGTTVFVDNDEFRQRLGYDVSSVESNTGFSNTGYSKIDNLCDEKKSGCSGVHEEDAQILGLPKEYEEAFAFMKRHERDV